MANGAARTITLPEGKTLQVTIPEGADDRQMLRLKEQGKPGFGGGAPGDAYVELHVEPTENRHPDARSAVKIIGKRSCFFGKGR